MFYFIILIISNFENDLALCQDISVTALQTCGFILVYEDEIFLYPVNERCVVDRFLVCSSVTPRFTFLAHLAEGNVSFCHHFASVVVCRPSSVVRKLFQKSSPLKLLHGLS